MTLDYGNYGIFLIVGNAGFLTSTLWMQLDPAPAAQVPALPVPRGFRQESFRQSG